jgi:hypothetical protein
LSLLEALRLNTEVLHLSGGDTPARLIQRGNDLVAFKNAKSAILVCETWITTISTDIPCTQAIEAGIPVSHPYETPKRMRELQEACESTGKIGRFMTITTPGEIERKGLSNFQEKGIKKATDYQYV